MIQTQNFVFMDIKNAAEALGIHPCTLQERAKAGLIPGAKIGKEWRFLEVDLVEYMRAQYPSNPHATLQPLPNVRKATVKTSTSLEEALNLPRQKAGKV